MQNRARLVIYISLLFFLTPLARSFSAQSLSTPQYHHNQFPQLLVAELSREGYFVVNTDQPPQQPLWLQQSQFADFREISAEYEWFADFQSMTLSGFADGHYYLRLRNENQQFSSSVMIEVRHYPLWQALSLFGLGLSLFMVLVYLVLTLHVRRNKDARND